MLTDLSLVGGKSNVSPSLVSSKIMLLHTAVGSSNFPAPVIWTPFRPRSHEEMLRVLQAVNTS
jgi:hypothetical protein